MRKVISFPQEFNDRMLVGQSGGQRLWIVRWSATDSQGNTVPVVYKWKDVLAYLFRLDTPLSTILDSQYCQGISFKYTALANGLNYLERKRARTLIYMLRNNYKVYWKAVEIDCIVAIMQRKDPEVITRIAWNIKKI